MRPLCERDPALSHTAEGPERRPGPSFSGGLAPREEFRSSYADPTGRGRRGTRPKRIRSGALGSVARRPCQTYSRVDQSGLPCCNDGLEPTVHPERDEHVGDVVPNGRRAQPELGCNLGRRPSAREET